MGRLPKPKDEKLKAGTYRADRDRAVTVRLPNDPPEMPLSLEKEGQRFWADAYACEWITTADRHQVQLVAEKKDERARVAREFAQNPSDFRIARTLQNIDRDIQSGLEQLLLTPHARKRAGVVLTTEKPIKSAIELMLDRNEGRISEEDYRNGMARYLPAANGQPETSNASESPKPGESKTT